MTTNATATLPRTCGCGETQDVTTVRMSDRLWTELFSVEGAERPQYAAACPVCISDWYRYAGPLDVVSTARTYVITGIDPQGYSKYADRNVQESQWVEMVAHYQALGWTHVHATPETF